MARTRGRGIEFLNVLPEDGERRLMLAVLIDAIRSYTSDRPTTPNIRSYREWLRERAWFASNDQAAPFAFGSICEALGLNADYVRRVVLRPRDGQRPVRVRRYTARTEEVWLRQRREYQASAAVGQAVAG
jgi:hypothetical protein